MNQLEAHLHSRRSVHFRPSLASKPSFRFSEGLVPRLTWCLMVEGQEHLEIHELLKRAATGMPKRLADKELLPRSQIRYQGKQASVSNGNHNRVVRIFVGLS